MTWEEIKAIPDGAEIEMTLRGVRRGYYSDIDTYVTFDDGTRSTSFTKAELTAPTARIEVLSTPVDPDVLAVREILAAQYESIGSVDWAVNYRAGDYDNRPNFTAALAAYRRVKG